MTQRTEANHNAIVDIIRQTAVAEAAEAASAAEFDNRKEATNARDNIVGAIDRAAENTDSMETYLQLTNLRAELTEAVPQSGLPELITRMIQNPQPSLVLAYEIYGDAKFADEIVQRNGIRHPGFICGEVEVLSEVST